MLKRILGLVLSLSIMFIDPSVFHAASYVELTGGNRFEDERFSIDLLTIGLSLFSQVAQYGYEFTIKAVSDEYIDICFKSRKEESDFDIILWGPDEYQRSFEMLDLRILQTKEYDSEAVNTVFLDVFMLCMPSSLSSDEIHEKMIEGAKSLGTVYSQDGISYCFDENEYLSLSVFPEGYNYKEKSLNEIYPVDDPDNKIQNSEDADHRCEVCGQPAYNRYTGIAGNEEWYCDEHYSEMIKLLNDLIESSNDTDDTDHECEVCGKPAGHEIVGLTGNEEWYCDEHYIEMLELLSGMYEDYIQNK